jgi:hypothetical protein
LADVLKQAGEFDYVITTDEEGEHQVKQNPRTGALEREWVPLVNDNDEPPKIVSVQCDVNGILDGGIRVAGTTERFDKEYNNVDFAHMWFPKRFIVTKRDRITNVRTARTGEVIWREEELDKVDGEYPATIFNVLGVTPVKDAFGQWIENRALLARADLKLDDD